MKELWIDSHAHLDDKKFDLDRELLISALSGQGISAVVNIGADMPSSRRSLALAEKYEPIYAVIGVHPHSASQMAEADFEELREMAKHEKVVAVGEIGLDFHYDFSPRDIQRKRFREQLELAKELDLPVVIHSREATEETLTIIREHHEGRLRGVMHCFSGSVEIMREYMKLGFLISLGGPVTFKNAQVPKAVAQEVPLDRLMLETDCPYMTPEPLRGKRNEPMFMRYTAEKIAELRGIPLSELAQKTRATTVEFFGLPEGLR